jgi:hypothetical protein
MKWQMARGITRWAGVILKREPGKGEGRLKDEVLETGHSVNFEYGNTIGSPEGDGCLDTLFRGAVDAGGSCRRSRPSRGRT